MTEANTFPNLNAKRAPMRAIRLISKSKNSHEKSTLYRNFNVASSGHASLPSFIGGNLCSLLTNCVWEAPFMD